MRALAVLALLSLAVAFAPAQDGALRPQAEAALKKLFPADPPPDNPPGIR